MFSKILVAYDGGDASGDSLDEAITLASTFHAPVHLVAVIHLSTGEALAEAAYPTGMTPGSDDEMRRSLAAVSERFAAQGCNVQTHIVIDNNPAGAIRELAMELGVDLIVLGHRRQGPLSRLWNGSVGLSLLAKAPCSIFVATGAPDAPYVRPSDRAGDGIGNTH
jgi:nucleotide-binding universal stress UspA family protein